MAPIYDSDVAEKRWEESTWTHMELWEKIEVRLRRRKWLWIAIAVVIFMLLSSVPTLMESWPRWSAVTASRRLAQLVNVIKKEATMDRSAHRIRFVDRVGLVYVVEKAPACEATTWSLVREGRLSSHRETLLSAEEGLARDIPGLVTTFCYDYLAGSEAALSGVSAVGFAVSPVKDLEEKRMDRVSTLIVSGASGEPVFE